MMNVYCDVFDVYNDLRESKDDISTFGLFLAILSAVKEQTSAAGNESLKRFARRHEEYFRNIRSQNGNK